MFSIGVLPVTVIGYRITGHNIIYDDIFLCGYLNLCVFCMEIKNIFKPDTYVQLQMCID